MSDSLWHYGVQRRSGRYPWGSGDDPHQHGDSIIARVDAYRRKGMSEKEAAAAVGMSIAAVRSQRSLEKAEARAADVAMAQRLKAKGMSYIAIGERMGRNESSIRSLLNPSIQERANITRQTADMLRNAVDKNEFIDVGKGVEARLGISRTRLDTSLKALENEGYTITNVQVDQLGTDKKTTVKVLAPPGTTYKDIVTQKERIRLPEEFSEDGGRTYLGIKPPVSISSKRLKVVYDEDGGGNKDGLIELRRGKEDLSLGTAKYAQVRIAVDGTHYLKGMAIHSDDLPPGVDIRFNTSKKKGTPLEDTLKKISDDPENPFGSSIKQFEYSDAKGKKHQSPLNIVGTETSPNVEGRWGEWSRTISSQVLSKQPTALAKQQLGLVVDQKKKEYEEISRLTNPAVKRRLLASLADDADAAAVHLKAAALPRQMNHVILPVVNMPEHQIYAPNYKNGEKVVIIRHPHGGKFEIPELTVNNNHPSAKRIMGNAKDAVGISPAVARRLSGADFDGDTVLVIPNSNIGNKIQTSEPLAKLKDFDPISEYPHVEGMKVMSAGQKQNAMGDISNLITDMTIKAASNDEIARAVKHSMVVIDAEKHKLNFKQSEADNGIKQLKEKYQGRKNAGASTLISKAGSDERIPARKEGALTGPKSSNTGLPTRQKIDPATGRKLYTPTGETYINKYGVEVNKLTKVNKMELVDDAHTLSSGTTMEKIYADHANSLKAIANIARRDLVHVKSTPYSPIAKRKYAKEVASLKDKLTAANANKPLERRAQIIANDIVATKRKANPHMTTEEIKKLKGQALTEGRNRVGAKKPAIIITPKEWAAIQSGAIANASLERIIENADLDVVRALATPRPTVKVSAASSSKARSLAVNGYTRAQIAEQLGVSTSTVSRMLDS
jgi:transposase